MRKIIAASVVVALMLPSLTANAYLMQILSYSDLFELADVVVIATPVETKNASVELPLEVEQPKDVTDLIKTVETKFEVGLSLKGKLPKPTFRLLHLNRKDGKTALMFGEVGTFFIDFHTEHNKHQSFLLFMKRTKEGMLCPAWRPMEGTRAIMPIKKDKTL
jgi:hypothetical protein